MKINTLWSQYYNHSTIAVFVSSRKYYLLTHVPVQSKDFHDKTDNRNVMITAALYYGFSCQTKFTDQLGVKQLENV